MAQVKKEEIRDHILSTAFQMIKEDGYEVMSMRNMASECGVSVSNLYNYFKNKEAILDELVGGFYVEIMTLSKVNKMKPVSLSQKDYMDYLTEATTILQNYIVKHKELLYVLIFQTKGSKYETFCDEMVQRYYDYEIWSVKGAFEGSKIPSLKGPSRIMLENLCSSYINLVKFYLKDHRSDEWLEEKVRELNEFVISGLGIYIKEIINKK